MLALQTHLSTNITGHCSEPFSACWPTQPPQSQSVRSTTTAYGQSFCTEIIVAPKANKIIPPTSNHRHHHPESEPQYALIASDASGSFVAGLPGAVAADASCCVAACLLLAELPCSFLVSSRTCDDHNGSVRRTTQC